MWELFGDVDQLVASKEEFGDVPANVVHQIELATRVDQLIALQVEHKVVKDHERPAKGDLLIDVSGFKDGEFTKVFVDERVLDMPHRVLVSHSVAALTDSHQHDKDSQTEDAEHLP